MRFVNNDHADTHVAHSSLPVGVIQPLRRDKEDFKLARDSLRQERLILFHTII